MPNDLHPGDLSSSAAIIVIKPILMISNCPCLEPCPTSLMH